MLFLDVLLFLRTIKFLHGTKTCLVWGRGTVVSGSAIAGLIVVVCNFSFCSFIVALFIIPNCDDEVDFLFIGYNTLKN